MSKEDDFRQNAADTLDLAQRAPSTADKSRLLTLAEKWLDLADRAQRMASAPAARRFREMHPLIRTKLGDRVIW